MLKDQIYFMHLSYHFSQTMWNSMRYPQNCFHTFSTKLEPPRQSNSKMWYQQNTLKHTYCCKIVHLQHCLSMGCQKHFNRVESKVFQQSTRLARLRWSQNPYILDILKLKIWVLKCRFLRCYIITDPLGITSCLFDVTVIDLAQVTCLLQSIKDCFRSSKKIKVIVTSRYWQWWWPFNKAIQWSQMLLWWSRTSAQLLF